MSIQDDIWDVESVLSSSKNKSKPGLKALQRLCEFLEEVENERNILRLENHELKMTIKTIVSIKNEA